MINFGSISDFITAILPIRVRFLYYQYLISFCAVENAFLKLISGILLTCAEYSEKSEFCVHPI